MTECPDIKKHRVCDDFSKAAPSYDDAAVVQHEVCKRALQRVDMLELKPATVLDVGCATGRCLQGLASRFPRSLMLACDLAMPMLLQHRRQPAGPGLAHLVCCDAEQMPFDEGTVDLLFSTSTFQWCTDLPRVLAECGRVLCAGGVLLFTTFGPDTLLQLRRSFARVDDLPHVHEFIDMHHIGDMMVEAGFVDPVVDMEMIDIQYPSVQQLLRDLKATGSQAKFEASRSKPPGLMGKRKFRSLLEAYEAYRLENGRFPASYEVIYGYARKPAHPGSTAAGPGEVRVPASGIRRLGEVQGLRGGTKTE